MPRLSPPGPAGIAPAQRVRGARRGIALAARVVLALVLLLALICALIAAYVGWKFTHPARSYATRTPAALGLAYQDVQFPSQLGHVRLSGWFLPAGAGTSTVIFAHGYAGHRFGEDGSMALAAALVRRGFNVLTFDFRGEGASQGDLVSIGLNERYDLLGAVRYVQRRFAGRDPRIGIMGFSMGAATALLAAQADQRDIRAVVSDSAFSDLYSYLQGNLPHWTHLPAVPFNALILWETPLLTGIDPHRVSPIAAVRDLPHTPVLFIAGLSDHTIPYSNSVQLYHAATDPADSLWLVPGADHTQAFATHPRAYERRLFAFFGRYLGANGAGA